MPRTVLILTLALGALALAVPAAAVPPVKSTFTAVGLEAPIECGNGVVLTESFRFTGDRITFFDDAGTRTGYILHGFYDGVIVNEATGARYRDRNHYTLKVDLVERTATYNGAVFQIHALDGGPVLILDVGHIVYSLPPNSTVLQASAQHPIQAAGLGADLEPAFCEALA